MSVRIHLALLILRIASASAFLYHGSAILFGVFGGAGPLKFAEAHHLNLFFGYLIGMVELGGGAAILLGGFSRIGASGIVCVVVGAIVTVHWRHGYDVSDGGSEYALTQMLIAASLLLTGPGKYSVSAILPARIREL